MLAHFRGNVVKLARHPCGSAVLEMAYSLSNAVQRSALVAEFYGPEFALKAHAAIVSGKGRRRTRRRARTTACSTSFYGHELHSKLALRIEPNLCIAYVMQNFSFYLDPIVAA